METFDPLNALALWDFEIRSFGNLDQGERDVLIVVGSRDLTYYHNAEIRFSGVQYTALPTRFSHAFFREASADEVVAVRLQAEFDCTLYCVIEENESSDQRSHFVAANSVTVSLETVRYPDER